MSMTLRDKLIFTIIDSRGRNDVSNAEVSYAESAADAIIERFGLTTETHAATHAKRNMTRITSAWEWDNQ